MLGQQPASSESHWHDHEYQLDPHRLQISSRQQEGETTPTAVAAQSAEGDIIPVLLGEGVNKKKYPLKCCIAKCGKDLSKEKDYYQRYRVCEEHLNLSALRLADGQEHRFCQQCGRFHPLLEFDGEKKSCRAKLQEHNDRRRKRPTAQQACQDVLEHSRPRRTRRTALPASPHLENETLAIRPQRVPRRLKTGPFAHLLPEEKATSTSSGAAPHSSDHASDSSTREEARESASSQEGTTRNASFTTLRQPIASQAQQPSSQSSREDSPQLAGQSQLDGAAEGSDAVAWLDQMHGGTRMTEDAATQAMPKRHLAKGHMPLPDTLQTSSPRPTAQSSEDDLLQDLYAQLAANPASSQVPAPNPFHMSIPFGHAQMQLPLYATGNSQASATGLQGYSQRLTSIQSSASARSGYQLVDDQLSDLERSMQSFKNPGLVDHLVSQSWQEQLFAESGAACRPLSAVATLGNAIDFEDHSRLDSAHQDDSMLLAMSMLLDGSSAPAPSTGLFPTAAPLTDLLPTAAPLTGLLPTAAPAAGLFPTAAPATGLLPDRQQTPPHIRPLPLAGPKAISSPPRNLQLTQQHPQAPPHSMALEGALALHHHLASHKADTTHLLNAPLQPQHGAGRQQLTDVNRLYHYQQYSLEPSQLVPPGCYATQAQLPAPPPLAVPAAQDLRQPGLLASGYLPSRTAQPQVHAGAMNNAAHNLRDFLDSSDLGRQAPQGLASGLTGLDKGHLHFPQDCNSSSWSNQGPVQQRTASGQHIGGMQSLQAGMGHQGLAQGVQYPGMDRPLHQERYSLDSMLYPAGPNQLQTTRAALNEPNQHMGRVNLKMLNQHPGSLPPHLLPHLSALSPEAQLTFMEGHMRPGCVHLVVDVMCTTNPAEWDVAAAAYCLMAFHTFWQQGTFLMQLPSGAVLWQDARIVKLWNSQQLLAAMPHLILGAAGSPMLQCIVSGQVSRLQVQGRKARPAASTAKAEQSSAATVLGRYMGKFVVNPDLQDCAACLQGSSGRASGSPDEVIVPGLAGVGVLTLEAQHNSILSAAQPVVVAPDAATQQDVCKLVTHLQAAGHPQGVISLLLVDIGMVLQYGEHLLDIDNSSDSDGIHDIPDWDGAWGDSALVSSQDSDISLFPSSDNSTHCGVLSAAASAVAHSNAGSMTYMSDDDNISEAEQRTHHAIGSPNDSLLEALWNSGSGPGGVPRGAGPEHAPFTHPLYVAHMVQKAKLLANLCRMHNLPALLAQVQDVAFSQQDPQQDTSLTSAPNSQQSNPDDTSTDPSHASGLQTAAAAARRFVLPTILESSLGSGTGSGGSECSRTVPLSPHGSSGRSELGFDVMELPEIVEAGPSSSEDPSQVVVSSQMVDAAGRPVITVVTPEGVRVLKDSAKEVHEEGGTLKVKAAEEDEPAADPVAQSRETASRMLMDTVDRMALRAAPYMPARLRQLVRPQPDQHEPAGLQPSRLSQLTSFKAVLAVVCLMLLSAMLLFGYGIHCVTTASPVLTRTLACVVIMVTVMRLLAVRQWGSGLELVVSLHPASARVYRAVLPHWNFLRESWLQACSGQPEQWDLVYSCTASCLSLFLMVITPHPHVASWPSNAVLPGLLVLSILPASVWAVDRDWYLAQRQRIQLALRSGTLVLVCMAMVGGLWTLPWLLLTMMHPFERAAQQQVLALVETMVLAGQAVSTVFSYSWSYWSYQGVVLFALVLKKLILLVLHMLALTLEPIPLPC